MLYAETLARINFVILLAYFIFTWTCVGDCINTSLSCWHCRPVDFKCPVELCARLVGSVFLGCSPLTSHVLGVYLSMVEVQDTSCQLVGSSCWGMCDISETSLLTHMVQHLTEPVILSTRYFHEDVLQFSRQPNL